MSPAPFFHDASGCVRFWVLVEDQYIGASIRRETLHYRFAPQAQDEDPVATYQAHAVDIDAAVRRRVAAGSREPVMLRDPDVHVDRAA